MWSFDELDVEQLTARHGDEVRTFLSKIDGEIEPYKILVAGLFNEHSIFSSLFNSPQFMVNKGSSLIDTISYILLLKQYELTNCAMDCLVIGNYMVCTTLIRSIFETNMFMVYLSHNPSDAEDFVAFSEIIGNSDVDWKLYNISGNKREKLEKKFSIRKMRQYLYAHTVDEHRRINIEHFYQQLCNSTHPSLEPSSIFYTAGNPPERSFSSVGIRRTVTQLFSDINITIECLVGAIYKSKPQLEDCYDRRAEIYRQHDIATTWHKSNPMALPHVTKNDEFRIGWKNEKAVITLIAEQAFVSS